MFYLSNYWCPIIFNKERVNQLKEKSRAYALAHLRAYKIAKQYIDTVRINI